MATRDGWILDERKTELGELRGQPIAFSLKE
jgi:hypothetical protein